MNAIRVCNFIDMLLRRCGHLCGWDRWEGEGIKHMCASVEGGPVGRRVLRLDSFFRSALALQVTRERAARRHGVWGLLCCIGAAGYQGCNISLACVCGWGGGP